MFASMTVTAEDRVKDLRVPSAREILDDLRVAVAAGQPWYGALLTAVARWHTPDEWVDGTYRRYLINGEAFDWLSLAERLLEEISELVPVEEQEALIFRGQSPIDDSPEEFRRAIGATKYRAHLNFLYGVVVEEALQLSVEEDVHKELRCRVWGQDRRVDETAFQRIYGKSKEALLAVFREQRGLGNSEEIGLVEWKEFSYWLFKYRLRQCDPAKVGSDTRRGLAQLSRMDNRQRSPLVETPRPEPEGIIEGRASAL